MARPALALAAAALALLLLAAALLLAGRTSGRRVRERVRAVGAGGQEARRAAAGVPSIRVARGSENRLLATLARLVGFSAEVPQANLVPWPAVAVGGLLVALFAWWRLRGLVGPLPAAAAALGAAGFAVRAAFRWQHRRYVDALFKQIPDALGLVVRAIRAGLPMTEALRGVAREMPAPSREEFARVVGEVAIGRSVDLALWKVYERSGLAEYAFLSVTLGLQSQTGGSLAETLDNLAELVRRRVAMAQRAVALAAEAKASAVILIALPFLCAGIMSFIRPGHMNTFFEDPAGFKMMMVGLTLMGIGIVMIRWLIRNATEG